MFSSQNGPARALLMSSLCLHVGFIGASASAVGLLQLFDGEAMWPLALVLASSGGAVAAKGWRLGRSLLVHRALAPRIDTDAPSAAISQSFQIDTEV